MAMRSMKTKARAFENHSVGRVVIVWNDDDEAAEGMLADLLSEGEIDASEQFICVGVEQEPVQWLN